MSLYHISLTKSNDLTWHPRLPAGVNPSKVPATLYSEEMEPRICTSPTIQQCFWGVWANIKDEFSIAGKAYLDFFVYEAMITPNSKIVPPEQLLRAMALHDAGLTMEHDILTPTNMALIAIIRIYNPIGNPCVCTKPFNMQDSKTTDKRPLINWDTITRYTGCTFHSKNTWANSGIPYMLSKYKVK